jgi:hypothetical protein
LREKLKFEISQQTRRDSEMQFNEESKQPKLAAENPSIYNFLPVALLGEGSYG